MTHSHSTWRVWTRRRHAVVLALVVGAASALNVSAAGAFVDLGHQVGDDPVLATEAGADDPFVDPFVDPLADGDPEPVALDPGADPVGEPVADPDPEPVDPVDEPAVPDPEPVVADPLEEPTPFVPPVVGDEDGGDPAALDVTIVVSADTVTELGEEVDYTVGITNTGGRAVELKRLADDRYGNLNGKGTCAVGGLIRPGESYECVFTQKVMGAPGSDIANQIRVVAVDAENDDEVEGGAGASVAVTDLEPAIELTYAASQKAVMAPGGEAMFSVRIANTSQASDPVTITSLDDSLHGDLDGKGSCEVPRTINPGKQYTCTFTALVGDEAPQVTDTVGVGEDPLDDATVADDPGLDGSGSETETLSATLTVTGTDDDGTAVQAEAEVSVAVVDPAVTLRVFVNDEAARTVPGPFVAVDGELTWSYVVTNRGSVALTGIRVFDDKRISVTCPGAELEAGASMTCTGTGKAVKGPYRTNATVKSAYTDPDGDQVRPSAVAAGHYFGAAAAVELRQTPGHQSVAAGQPARFTITVVNTGNVPLTDAVVANPDAADCARTIPILEPGEEQTYDCEAPAPDDDVTMISTVAATAPTDEEVTDSVEARVIRPVGRLVDAGTSCTDFLAGRIDDVDELRYNVGRNGRIGSVAPGIFSYVTVVTVEKGDVVTVNQRDDGSTPVMDIYQTSQAVLWRPDCTKAVSGSSTRGTATVTFLAPAAGTYVLSVKYTPDSTKTSINPGQVTYEFSTAINGAPLEGTLDSLVLRQK